MAPTVQALIAAIDAIDHPEDAASHSQAWGTSGLGAGQVSEADIEALARLHHRLTAQIGRLIHGPVSAGHVPTSPNASSLVPQDPASTPVLDPPLGGDTDFSRPSLPFGGQATLVRRGWRPAQARTVITAARFSTKYPDLERMWRDGDISAETVFALQRTCRKLSDEQETDFMTILLDHLSDLTYQQVHRLTARVLDLIRPDSIDEDEKTAYQNRSLTFSNLGDSVLFQGQLPKLEGQAFQDTITAIAEKQRTQSDLLTAGQRKADALTELIVNSAVTGQTPTLGGLPVAVTLTMSPNQAEIATTGTNNHDHGRRATYPDGDLVATAVTRFALCCAEITPITCTDTTDTTDTRGSETSGQNRGSRDDATGNPEIDPKTGAGFGPQNAGEPHNTKSSRADPLLERLLGSPRLPIAVGRAQRLATTTQRKALALRDGGCIIPGCDLPPNRTQPHHVNDYSLGGPTDLDNLASLCWVHHRQVDHHYWALSPNPEPTTGPYWIAKRNFRYKN